MVSSHSRGRSVLLALVLKNELFNILQTLLEKGIRHEVKTADENKLCRRIGT